MKAHERVVAGIRCGEVLEDLSAHLDGELDEAGARRIAAHLRGCDRCERFGGRFAAAVAALRRQLAEAPPPEEVRARLMERLRREPAPEG